METVRLKQFCVIAEAGSLSKAASLLHISHSGLSKSMKILQDELKLRLFRPAGRGLVLTEDGLVIYRKAKSFLELEQQLFDNPEPQQATSLKIGTMEIFIPSLCEQLHLYSTKTENISILDLNPGQIEKMLANHELDFGITYSPFPMHSIDIIEAAEYQLGCYHLEGCFSGVDILNIPFAVPAVAIPSNPLGIKERDGWIDTIIPRKRKYHVNLLSTAIELTLQGRCAVYIPSFVARQLNKRLASNKKLVEKPLPDEHKNHQQIFILKHQDKPADGQFDKLVEMIKRFN